VIKAKAPEETGSKSAGADNVVEEAKVAVEPAASSSKMQALQESL